MRSKAKYVKKDKVYKTKKNAWRPRRVTLWLLVPLVLFCGLGVYCIYSGVGFETEGTTDYQVEGKIDYKVYLKDNDYYEEKFLGPGMQYIASLINVVHTDFDYVFSANDDLNINYDYKVVAQTRVTDRSDSSKVLYDVSEDLLTKKSNQTENGEIAIREGLDIDYGKYNQKMREFRNTFGVAANCELILKMVVNTDGAVKTNDEMSIEIPLSEQTLDIEMNTAGLNRQGQLGEASEVFYVKNTSVLVSGAVITVLSLVMMGVVIYYYATRFNGDLYEKALHKILKEYDTYIVEANGTIYEHENVVRVMSFKELLDAQSLESSPIVFLEVEPGNKSYFVVNGTNTTYRFTLSRAYQDLLQEEGESEW